MAAEQNSSGFTKEERIAVFLASLDEELAASILQQMPPELMGRITATIARLGAIPGSVRRDIVNQCLREIGELGHGVYGDDTVASSLLSRAIGEKRASVLLSEQSPHKGAFASLRDVEPEQLASVLSREQPGVIAIVLNFVTAPMASAVVEALPGELRKQVIVRMATANMPPTEEVIEGIEEVLESKLVRTRGRKSIVPEDKGEIIAGILQHIDPFVEDELMEAIEETSPAFATEIRDRLFTFEDIVKLSDVAVRRILQEIDMSVLAVALRNASLALREKFFGNMSKRASSGLREDMAYSPKIRLSEVQARQRDIVNIIRTLEMSGQIRISRGEEEDAYV